MNPATLKVSYLVFRKKGIFGRILFALLTLMGMNSLCQAASLMSPDVTGQCSGDTEMVATAWPNGQIVICWEYNDAYAIDGFKLFRSPKTKNNQDGMLGPFNQVAIIPKAAREFTLSAPAGTYCYFLIAYRGSEVSTASNQLKVEYVK